MLSGDAAVIEAKKLVSSRQIWVHKINGIVVSIAAFTRNTKQIATITKVSNRLHTHCKLLSFAIFRSLQTLSIADLDVQNASSVVCAISKFLHTV